MKRLFPNLCLLATFACTCSLSAEPPKENEPQVKLETSYNHINPAKFTRSDSQRGHHLSFTEGYVLGIYKHQLQHDRKLSLGVGYMGTKFHFSHHPHHTSFRERHFDNVLVHFGASTKEIERWKWDAKLNLQINAQHFTLSRYTFINGVLHGRYDWFDKRHLHVGIVGFTGMHYTRLLPIDGFDYKYSDKWKFNAVFPLNMSVVYNLTERWSLDAALRYFLTCQRLGLHEHFRRGVVAYTNWGTELGLNYAFNERAGVNLHLGESFAGRMRLSHRNDHHRHHLRLNSALYYGLNASVSF